tara:strand:- start:4425 stop:5636 length:1212 start_codon:yes stop_codon:yes gene_type:complete
MIDTIKPLIKQFLPFAQERMGFRDPPKLFIREDEENAQNPLGKTAFYNPGSKSVTLYVTGRHPKDVMRSLSHELVHHTQNCNGHFDNVGEMGDGYAQNDEHLREMERQAYEIGNLCFRDWEDSIKHTIYFEHLQKGVEKVMSIKDWKNGEIKTLLTEKWGFRFNLDKLNEESAYTTGASEDETEGTAGTETEKENLDGTLDEMGCGDHAEMGDEVTVMQSAEDEGPSDPNALVDELSDIVARLSAALGGGDVESEEETEMVVDMQERLRTAIKKALVETGSKKDGESEGDESDTHPGTDYSKRHPHHKVSHGDSDDSDSGATDGDGTEKEHYRDNAMSDEEHIKAIEHHLDALRKDHDYDEEEVDDLEERRAKGRKGPSTRGIPDPRLREAVLRAFKAAIVKK